jgi:hypothetical protein
MGVVIRTPSRVLAGLALVALLGACGDGDARYAGAPDDGLGVDWYVAAAAVDQDGTVVVAGRSGVNLIPAGDAGERPIKRFALPSGVAGGATDLHGLSSDVAGNAWVLVGPQLVPVRISGGTVHAATPGLTAVHDAAAAVPGVTGTDPRDVSAVGVIDDGTLLVGSRGRDGGPVLLHRLVAGGAATVVAGRGAPAEGQKRFAADEPPNRAVPAVAVDLDPVVAAVALRNGDTLLATTFRDTGLPEDYPNRLTLFVLHGDTIRRLPVDELFVGPTLPAAIVSVPRDGTAVVEARLRTGDAEPRPAVLSLDLASGRTTVVSRDLLRSGDEGIQVMVAGRGDDRLTVVTPRGGDAEDDDNVDAVRITTADLPKDG